jgi:hypothetical protein
LPRAFQVKKIIALALSTVKELPRPRARDFARCVLLNAGQWALNGRRQIPGVAEFRTEVAATALGMLAAMNEFRRELGSKSHQEVALAERDAAELGSWDKLRRMGNGDLVVTSPPYPGIHMLYHRWQVDGRHETPAPYWIAGCQDGAGAAFYGFGDHRAKGAEGYYSKSQAALQSIRRVVRRGAVFVQLISFSKPRSQLKRYLRNMEMAGVEEVRGDEHMGLGSHRRFWRAVPGRRWHATMKGQLESSREVLLLHQAV